MDSNRVIIFDTTLRDGEQSPGCTLNLAEKLEIARQLARLFCEAIQKKPASMTRYFQMLHAKKLVSRKPERTTLDVGVNHRKQVPHTRTMQVYVYRITKAGTKLLI